MVGVVDDAVACRIGCPHTQHLPLYLADIGMPSMDGYQFYHAVRANVEWTSIPFIFLTTRAEQEDVLKGKALGVENYLTKPVDP